jgi:tol-pal system protein YbgF
MPRLAGLPLVAVLALAACAAPAGRAATPPAPPVPVAAAPAVPKEEPPRPADQVARIASELSELQNTIAKLMMSARQHDDQLLYLQRRVTELEAQTRGRATAPHGFAPSAAVPAPLPPPPATSAAVGAPPAALPAPLPPLLPSVPRALPPGPAAAAVRPPASPPARPAPAPPSASGADMLYQEGLEKYESGDLDSAVVTLYDVVVNYPGDPARERAQFLVADIFLSQKDYRGAVAEFESLIAAVPSGTRIPDAFLKLGMAQRALGDEARARRSWERLVKDYPNSAAARQARTLLRAAR